MIDYKTVICQCGYWATVVEIFSFILFAERKRNVTLAVCTTSMAVSKKADTTSEIIMSISIVWSEII